MRNIRARQLRKLALQEFPDVKKKFPRTSFKHFYRWVKEKYLSGELRYMKTGA